MTFSEYLDKVKTELIRQMPRKNENQIESILKEEMEEIKGSYKCYIDENSKVQAATKPSTLASNFAMWY